jgi:hypothetical protein
VSSVVSAHQYIRETQPTSISVNEGEVRYLVLTKDNIYISEAHDVADQLNATVTRLFCVLMDWKLIRGVGLRLSLLNRLMDAVLSQWSDERRKIEDHYSWKLSKLLHPELTEKEDELASLLRTRVGEKQEYINYGRLVSEIMKDRSFDRNNFQRVPSIQEQMLNDQRIKELDSLVKRTERRLSEIGHSIDESVEHGDLLKILRRCKRYMEEFDKMWPMLGSSTIDGWYGYKLFVDKYAKPTFMQISTTDERMFSLKQRFGQVVDSVQTTALIVKTEATRANTEVIRRISSNIYFLPLPLSLILSYFVISSKSTFFNNDWEFWVRICIAVAVPLFFLFLLQYWQRKAGAD